MAANRRSTRPSLISQGQSHRRSTAEDMMELSLTRAPLRRGSDAEPNDGFPGKSREMQLVGQLRPRPQDLQGRNPPGALYDAIVQLSSYPPPIENTSKPSSFRGYDCGPIPRPTDSRGRTDV